jgi:flagellar motor switch protein FliG
MKNEQEKDAKLTGAQKVAVLLLSLPQETTLKLFSMLKEDEIVDISYAMANSGTVNSSTAFDIIDEFKNEVSNNATLFGSIEITEKILSKFLSNDKLQVIMDQIKGPKGKNTWEKLANVNEEMLAGYLSNEHPQIATLVLSKIQPDQAAKVLKNMPDSLSFEIISRMLNITSVKNEIVSTVENVIKSEFVSITSKTKKQNSFNMIASILNTLDRETEAKYISKIESKFPEEAVKIKNLMFTFDDLIKVDTQGIQFIIRSIDKSILPLALRGASDEIKDLFFSSMSQRQSRIIMEEMEASGRVRAKDVYNAQSTIVSKAKQLIALGEIDLIDQKDDSKFL